MSQQFLMENIRHKYGTNMVFFLKTRMFLSLTGSENNSLHADIGLLTLQH